MAVVDGTLGTDAADGSLAASDADAGDGSIEAANVDAADGSLDAADADAGDESLETADADGSTDVPDVRGGEASPDDSTRSILGAQGPGCLACAEDSGSLDPTSGGSNCETFTGANVGYCLAVLQCIFDSGCLHTGGDPTVCVCGAAGPACLDRTVPAQGPCINEYYMAFGTHSVPDFANSLYDTAFPGGVPGSIASVLSSYGYACPCEGDD